MDGSYKNYLTLAVWVFSPSEKKDFFFCFFLGNKSPFPHISFTLQGQSFSSIR